MVDTHWRDSTWLGKQRTRCTFITWFYPKNMVKEKVRKYEIYSTSAFYSKTILQYHSYPWKVHTGTNISRHFKNPRLSIKSFRDITSGRREWR